MARKAAVPVTLVEAVRDDLDRLPPGSAGSRGTLALKLAATLDEGAGSQVAAVARELRSVMADLMVGVKVEKGGLDELRARRARDSA